MGFENRGFGGGGGFQKREMHDAVCSECGKDCKVPFKPSKDREGNPRPVFCRDCFQKRKPQSDF